MAMNEDRQTRQDRHIKGHERKAQTQADTHQQMWAFRGGGATDAVAFALGLHPKVLLEVVALPK